MKRNIVVTIIHLVMNDALCCLVFSYTPVSCFRNKIPSINYLRMYRVCMHLRARVHTGTYVGLCSQISFIVSYLEVGADIQ